jgi:hypothetical protein
MGVKSKPESLTVKELHEILKINMCIGLQAQGFEFQSLSLLLLVLVQQLWLQKSWNESIPDQNPAKQI